MPVNSFTNYDMSWKPTLKNRKPPIYKQLAYQLEEDIKNGILKPGDKMPPQRELADFLDLNLSTITRTYNLCEKEGLLTAHTGKGTFISTGANISDILLLPNKENFIYLDTIHPLYSYNKDIINYIKEILNTPDSYKLLEYHTPTTNIFYKQAIINFLKSFGEKIEEQNILFATGGQNALCGILLGLLQPGDKIGTNSLSFPGLKGIAKQLHIQLIPLSEHEGRIDINHLSQDIKQKRLKAIYLIPDIHNPTTITLTLEERKRISEIAVQNNCFIISDEINKLFAPKKSISFYSLAPTHTIEIFSISKFLAPSLRVAYVITPSSQKEILEKAFYDMNLMVSPMNIEIVSKLLNSTLFSRILLKRKKELIKRNKLVNEILKDYNIAGAQTSTIRWLTLPNHINSKAFETECLKNHIKIFLAERFIIGNSTPPNAVRLCISSPKTLKELQTALITIKNILQ